MPMLLRIRRVIQEHGGTQEGFAELVQVPRETVNRWANGRSAISAESAARIHGATGLSADLFVKARNGALSEQVAAVTERLDRFGERLERVEVLFRELLDELRRDRELPREREVQ